MSADLASRRLPQGMTASQPPEAPGWEAPPHRLRPPPPLPEGLDAWVHRWHGRWRRRSALAHRLRGQAAEAAALCAQMSSWDEAQHTQACAEVRQAMVRAPQEGAGRLVLALALVGHLAERVLGMRPYEVQFMGALALHGGYLAEMATGEGKTLTVGLAAVLAGWSARPCHVITANDYLAQRDADHLRPLFAAAGLQVGAVHADVPVEQRATAYNADVVYVTPKDLLADYLREQMAARQGVSPSRTRLHQWLGLSTSPSGRVLVRGLHTAIVDEADSVLIDEAVTPLILSARRPAMGLDVAVRYMARLALDLQPGHHFQLQARLRQVHLLDAARALLAESASVLPAAWRAAPRREALLSQALQVRYFFRVGQQYLVHDGEIVLLDEATGRMTPGRTLTAGLHQAIEASEGLPISDPNEAMSQMSFQAFFRSFARLSGCSGTGLETADEVWQVYRLSVVRIPTHRPRRTRYWPAQWVPSEQAKWEAVAAQVRELQGQGRAVLVGVRSVHASKALAAVLHQLGLPAVVLNAEAHAEEADIVARAGAVGSLTIATNMAGRGTDIPLHPHVRAAGGLHVVVAEVNDSARVDRQLAGRCGRQGDPGSVSTFVSPEDLLVQRYWSPSARALVSVLRALDRIAPRLTGWCLSQLVAHAQQRSEADAFARRLAVLKADEWMAQALPFQEAAS
jgi:preprotein translocase subunit SecA